MNACQYCGTGSKIHPVDAAACRRYATAALSVAAQLGAAIQQAFGFRVTTMHNTATGDMIVNMADGSQPPQSVDTFVEGFMAAVKVLTQ